MGEKVYSTKDYYKNKYFDTPDEEIFTTEELFDTVSIPDNVKNYYASMETSRDTSGDWLQLEESTFNDLKTNKKIRKDISFKDLKDRPAEYDEVADSYIKDLKKKTGITDDKEAALWSWRPGWYKRYDGKIENIPDSKTVPIGKKRMKSKDVMKSRKKNLNKYLLEAGEDLLSFLDLSVGDANAGESEIFTTEELFGGTDESETFTTEELFGGEVDSKPESTNYWKHVGKEFKGSADQFVGALKTAGQAITKLPSNIGAAVLKAHQGAEGASVVDKGWIQKTLQDADTNADEFVRDIYKKYEDKQAIKGIPIKITDIAELPRNIAFSVTSMAAGLAAGTPIAFAPIPGARVAAWSLGTVASGKAAYEMSTYEIMQEYLEAKNDESIETKGKGITIEEENELKKIFGYEAAKYGLWEAVPEALSNLAFAKILTAPLAKIAGKNIATRIVAKMTGLYGEELLTETITQKGQAGIEKEAGLREEDINWGQALKEVAPQTFLLTTVMGGAGASAIAIKNKVMPSLAKEIKTKKITPEQEEIIRQELEDHIDKVLKEGKPIDIIPIGIQDPKEKQKQLKEVGVRDDLINIIIEEDVAVEFHENEDWDENFFPAVLAEGMFIKGAKINGKVRKPAFHIRKNIQRGNINDVVAHEMGHHLDEKLGLGKKVYNKGDSFINKVFRAGFQNLAKDDLSGEALEKWRKAFRDGDPHFAGEAIAEIVRRWKLEPNFAKENPEIAEFLEQELGTKKQLKQIKQIAQPPEKPIEPQKEKAVAEPEIIEKVKPIAEEGEGEEKVHGLSKSVERQAIKEGFVEEFSDLPTYKTRNVEDAAERATDFIEKNYDLAKKIALGEAPEQGNVRSQELFKAISIQAYASGDIDTITELAFSKKAASIATELGQRVQAYDTGNRYDPIQTIRKVIKEREEFSKGHPKSEKEISNLKQKLDETESKIKELEKKLEESKVTRKEKKKAFGSDNKVFTQQKLEEARKNLRAKMSGLHAGVDPTAVVELTEIGGFYFEGGIREFSAWSKMLIAEFGDNIKPYLSDVWKNVRAEYKKHNIENAKEKIGKMAEEGMSLPKPFVVQSIAEELVESGVVNRANLVEAVREILQDSYPDITYRETADLISGYGQYSRLSKDAVKKILRDIKGQLQQLSKLEDLQEGISPLKTGTERRAVSDEERRLIKLVEEAKRKYRVKTTDPETQLRSALDSYKAGLRNQIKDLEKQILERKKIIKDKTPLSLDEEAVRLMIKKNELRLIFSAIFSKKGLTTEQRIKIAEKSLARSIETYERKLKEGDISPITKKRTPISTPKIEQLRTKRETLKKQLDDIRNLAKPKKTQQEISLQTLKTRLNNEITRLEDRIERLDFEVEQKREVILDAEAQKLKDKRESIKHGYDAARHIEATLTKEEISKIVSLSSDVSDAQKKVEVKGDWTADNAKDVEDFFYKKNEFEEYVDSLKPKSTSDNINRFFDYIRASILASPRILQNSFLYQIVPGIERTITKRIVTGVFNDADLKSTIVEKYLAKLSGVTPSKKSLDFIKRQVAMAIRIYHKTGIDISRQDKMESTPKFYGETFSKITGKSVFAKIGRTVNLAPKWLAGGTDMFFANIGRADTAIMMSKERAKIEALNEKLPEGMTEEQRADQLLKESYSFNPKDKRAEEIRERGIEDAHRMNNTQSGWWSDTIIELRKLLRIGNIRFGKAIIPFAKIANVVIAEGTKTATGLGIARSIYDINVAARKSNAKDRSKLMNSAVNNLIRYVGLMGAAILLTSFFDDDDYIGTYSSLSNKQYQLSVARGARTGSVRIAGRWISLRYLPMINIPISAIMEARQAKGTGDSIVAGYARGIAGQILEAPGIKELGQGFVKLKRSVKPSDTEKLLNSLGLDGERILNWAKVRAIPSVLSYDVWNALFPKKGKYDFMGREVKRGGAFRDDKSNNITVEFSRLSKEGYFPTISNPTGAYAVKLEEHLGEEEYAEVLAELQQNYADKVSTIINSTGYKLTSDEKKKKRIDRIRDKEILHELRRKERKLPK